MAYKRMEVDSYGHTISYFPPSEADFQPIRFSYPTVANKDLAETVQSDLEDRIHSACGRTACGARVNLATGESALDERIRRHLGGDIKWLQGAVLQCNTDQCPLDGPGGAGDREPRNPIPEPPALHSELPPSESEEISVS